MLCCCAFCARHIRRDLLSYEEGSFTVETVCSHASLTEGGRPTSVRAAPAPLLGSQTRSRGIWLHAAQKARGISNPGESGATGPQTTLRVARLPVVHVSTSPRSWVDSWLEETHLCVGQRRRGTQADREVKKKKTATILSRDSVGLRVMRTAGGLLVSWQLELPAGSCGQSNGS